PWARAWLPPCQTRAQRSRRPLLDRPMPLLRPLSQPLELPLLAPALDERGTAAVEVLCEPGAVLDERGLGEGHALLVGPEAREVRAGETGRGRRLLRAAHAHLCCARGVDALAGGGERRGGRTRLLLRPLAEASAQAEDAGQAKECRHHSLARPASAATLSSNDARWSRGWRRKAVISGRPAIASSMAALEPRAYAPRWIRSSAPRCAATQARTRPACAC